MHHLQALKLMKLLKVYSVFVTSASASADISFSADERSGAPSRLLCELDGFLCGMTSGVGMAFPVIIVASFFLVLFATL